MNSKIFWKLSIAMNLSLSMVFCDFSKFQLIPTAIAQTNNSSVLGCWITAYRTGQAVNTITMEIYGDNTWELVTRMKFPPKAKRKDFEFSTSGNWYIQGLQLVTQEKDRGTKSIFVQPAPNTLEVISGGGLVFNRCNN
jgi:hypothetical protein